LITALASAIRLRSTALSLNVSASTLSADPRFGAFLVKALREVGRRPCDTMLEVVDLTPAFDRRVFRDNLNEVRAAGVRLALDRFGSGHSNHLMLLDVRPDDLKIDRCLLRTAEADAYGRAVLGSLVELAEKLGIRTIAQGVETSADLGALQSAGIGLAQGFFFMPPLSAEALMLAGDPGTGTV
jgi:EAL domain-containing protein (putative c-di-GMP-specific phosphodiesterase class I)